MDTSETVSTPIQRTPIQSLEDRIALLTELDTTVQSLRKPTSFLRPPEITSGIAVGGGVVSIYHDPPIQSGFEQLKALSEKLQTKPVQEALKVAQESGTKEPLGLSFGRKRRQPPKQVSCSDQTLMNWHGSLEDPWHQNLPSPSVPSNPKLALSSHPIPNRHTTRYVWTTLQNMYKITLAPTTLSYRSGLPRNTHPIAHYQILPSYGLSSQMCSLSTWHWVQ